MVYCGKPSKGCEPCRKRRVKCDQERPACTQCVRTQRPCAYRDLDALVFRDQNELVRRRARRWKVKKSKEAPTRSNGIETGAAPAHSGDPIVSDSDMREVLAPHHSATTSLLALQSITVSIEDQASSFFLKNYVLGNSRSFDYLQSFTNSGMEEHLALCGHAVALATLSSERQSPELEKSALRAYTVALQSINLALQSLDVARKDSTLVAVILLDLFEKLIPSRRNHLPVKSETNHINGATALVRLRGYEQFQSRLGLRIFLQISSAIMVSCMTHGTAVPADIIALRTYATNFVDTDDPVWRISQTFIRLVNLCAAVKDDAVSDPAAIIPAATNLDTDCIALSNDIASKWQYTTIYTDPSASVYEGYYHIHDDYRIVQLWNSLRLGRLLLNEIIHNQYIKAFTSSPRAFLSAKHTARFQLATDNILELASEICATVPQFVDNEGKKEQRDQAATPSSTASNFTNFEKQASSLYVKTHQPREDPTPLAIAGAYSLLFPLFVVGYSHIIPHRLHSWVLDRMNFIGRIMDIPQAYMIVDILEGREEINVWAVYAMLGSHLYPD